MFIAKSLRRYSPAIESLQSATGNVSPTRQKTCVSATTGLTMEVCHSPINAYARFGPHCTKYRATNGSIILSAEPGPQALKTLSSIADVHWRVPLPFLVPQGSRLSAREDDRRMMSRACMVRQEAMSRWRQRAEGRLILCFYHATGPKRKITGVWGQRPQDIEQPAPSSLRPSASPAVKEWLPILR